jgi:CxxC motif-containing protein (DUF1111 family)
MKSSALLVIVAIAACRQATVTIGEARPDLPPAARAAFARGRALFTRRFDAASGLGPLYNDVSCVACHDSPVPGGGGDAAHGLQLIAVAGAKSFDRRPRHASSGHSPPALPAGAVLIPVRPPPLYGLGLLDQVSEAELRAACAAHDGVRGHANLRRDGRLGRFGHKSASPDLRMMIAIALHDEMGLTNPVARPDYDDDGVADPEASAEVLDGLTAFVAGLAPPPRAGAHPAGERLFNDVGCAACHRRDLGPARGAYTDLCVHSLGPAFDTGVDEAEYSDLADEWRTTPLWGLRYRRAFFHDERARDLESAILAHGGEADAARRRYQSLPDADRRALREFLGTL